jgi:hypothetical protein
LSKLGCNAGTCHGSAEGKNGFKLSLRGYDPLFDHRALTDDLEGRRFNRAAPDRSLMLMKPAGAVPHVGGVVWQPKDPYYELVKTWITEGVHLDLKTPRVASIEVQPQGPIVPVIGMKQQFAVIAQYTDGSSRDVTAESFLESSNTEVATVDKNALCTTVRRGEATMLARYEGAYSASTVIVMGDRSGFQWTNPEAFNFIDELVYEKLKRIKVLPSEVCTDAEFLRRIYLDLTGLPPEPEEVRKFLDDKRPTKEKRNELIDKLVGSDAYIEHWTNKWADLLQVNRKFLGDPGAKSLRDFIRKSMADNLPYNEFAHQILTGSGSNIQNPGAAYLKVLRTPDAAMENTTHLFMAIRFNCNKCHDHPFERWTQDQYYHLASYFAQVSRKEDPKFEKQKIGGTNVELPLPLVEIIEDTKSGEVKHERTGEFTTPKFPFTHSDMPNPNDPRRQQLGKWIISKSNPYFAKSYVNRMWSYLTGVGLIEPIDDIRAGNPPSNPALLDRLTKEFLDKNFDVRHLIKTICKSRTYQLSINTSQWNEGDDLNYAHALVRRLPAEVLFDSIHRVTGATTNIPGLPPGARAAQVLDGSVPLPSGFLELFGKPVRESACECERSSSLQLGPVLNLINGPIVGEAIRSNGNRLDQLAEKYKDDTQYVQELYLAVLNRYPTDKELKLGLQSLKEGVGDHTRAVEEYTKKKETFNAYEKQVDSRQADWEKKMQNAPKWETIDIKTAVAKIKGTKLTTQKDGSIFVTGTNSGPETYTLIGSTKLKTITGIRLEALASNKLPGNGPGRPANGNFVLNEFEVNLISSLVGPTKSLELHKAVATFSQEQYGIAGAIDRNPQSGWAIVPQTGKTHVAIFELKTPITNEKGTQFRISMDQLYPNKDHNLGNFRISVTSDPVPKLGDPVPANVAKLLEIPSDKRTGEQKAELVRTHRSLDPEYNRLRGTLVNPPSKDPRVIGAQDLVWALINNPAFLFNH